ncbi:uncharacterized protein BT62DRAFT_415207 [Guyanagaster necrorhizus]|uniref:Uncharacterized protein n=1 Tax=Guyanagaster necrorhizus TaxID=856835 RepID=A0A9P7W2D3_9AGAR|nr:uncharacterized protein BT62DRAFT_415207 [Guyanagaster necrorhizus MCA 3950]KAG7451314.1 hypothetical protein BT62DRAFT_415207 [Guyanagaster necrorhizus MCA 3950]
MIRPTERDLKVIEPTFTKRWNEFFLKAPDKLVVWIGPASKFCIPHDNLGASFYISLSDTIRNTVRLWAELALIHTLLLTWRPASLTSMWFSSWRADPSDLVLCSSPADLAVLGWAYKHSRKLARRMDAYRGCLYGVILDSPKERGSRRIPSSRSDCCVAPDINYAKEDDDAIDGYLRLH